MLRKPASQAAAELNIDNESNAGEQLDEEEEVVGPGLVQLNIDPTDSSSQKNTGHDGGWKKAGREENKGKARRRYSVATYGKSEAQTRRIEADRRRLDAQRAQLRAHGMAVGRGEFAFGAGAAAADPVPAHLNLLLELVLQQGLPVRKHPRGFPHRPLPRVLMLVANPPRVVCCRPGHALRGNYKKGIDICAIERILVGQVDRYPDTEVFRRVGRGGGGKAARGGGPACCLSLVATPPPPPEEEAPAGADGSRKNKRQASHGSVVDKIRPSLDIEVDTPEDCIELANALALYIQKLRPDIRNAIELPACRRSLAERVAADAVAGRRGSTSSAGGGGGGGGRGRRTLRLLLGRSGASDTSRKREESQVSTVSGLLPGSANENEKQLASGSKTPEIQI